MSLARISAYELIGKRNDFAAKKAMMTHRYEVIKNNDINKTEKNPHRMETVLALMEGVGCGNR